MVPDHPRPHPREDEDASEHLRRPRPGRPGPHERGHGRQAAETRTALTVLLAGAACW
ncbi:hypothetical protein QJS66_08110 [Kocuria rhizophila]|nr:hypothetical protein QJS66_08110 [Kocuria rhizophila]